MRTILRWIAGLACALAVASAIAAGLPEAVVYKSPTCGCCGSWVDHMKASGFKVKVIEQDDVTPVKQRYGVPDHLASCHTALIGGYVVEGHVPASTVKRMLKEKPSAVGVSVPGMPIGAPGMPGPNPESFSTQIFDERGRARVYETFRPPYRW